MKKWGLIDNLGQWLIEPRFNYMSVLGHGLIGAVTDNERQFLDIDGVQRFAGLFTFAREFSEGLSAVKSDGLYGYINLAGEHKIEPRFFHASSFCNGRAFVTETQGGGGGVIDHTGRYIIDPRFRQGDCYACGRAAVCENYPHYYYIDRDGNAVGPQDHLHIWTYSEGLAYAEGPMQCGFYDLRGELVIKATDWSGFLFDEGLARVTRHIDGKEGYIDRRGDLIIPPAFDAAGRFSEGLADAKVGKRIGYIDRTGHFVIEPRYRLAKPFQEGLAWVSFDGDHFICIDRTGEPAFGAMFITAHSFTEGVASVCVEM